MVTVNIPIMNDCQDKNIPFETIGARIRSVRESQVLTQAEFAKKLGVKQAFISKIEKNNASLTIDHLMLIRNIFNVDLNWLLTGKGIAPEAAIRPVGVLVQKMLVEMPEEAQRDVLKYAEEKKLLGECLEQIRGKKGGGI